MVDTAALNANSSVSMSLSRPADSATARSPSSSIPPSRSSRLGPTVLRNGGKQSGHGRAEPWPNTLGDDGLLLVRRGGRIREQLTQLLRVADDWAAAKSSSPMRNPSLARSMLPPRAVSANLDAATPAWLRSPCVTCPALR